MLALGRYRHPFLRFCFALSRDGHPGRGPDHLVIVLGILAVLILAGQLSAGDTKKVYRYRYGGKSAQGAAKANLDAGKKREREGTEIKAVRGIFKEAGDRFTFYPTREGKPTDGFYPVLENLALERINRIYSEGGQSRFWTISGKLTEYRGSNFLLISKATLMRKRSK